MKKRRRIKDHMGFWILNGWNYSHSQIFIILKSNNVELNFSHELSYFISSPWLLETLPFEITNVHKDKKYN